MFDAALVMVYANRRLADPNICPAMEHSNQTLNSWTFKSQIWIVIGICVATFLCHRHALRPWVLDNFQTGLFVIVVNSFPNFLEGVMGSISLASLGMWFRNRNGNWDPGKETPAFFNSVTIIAAAYVIPQELNWFTLTRENTFDRYDVIASILGLVLINRIMVSCGLFAYRADDAG